MSASHRSRNKKSDAEAKPPQKRFKVDPSLLMMAGIMLLGFIVRMLPVMYAIVGKMVILNGPDSYYHMRRTVYTVLHYPFTNFYDSYVNYPQGYHISWMPLFDIMNATASLIAGLGHPDTFTIEVASSVVPVLIGVATLAVLYYFIKEVLDEKTALISTLIMAILPAGVFRSLFGVVDHHGLEVLASLTMFLLFMRAVSSAKKAGLGASGLGPRTPLLYAALAGAAIACMVISWDGAPIFIAIIVVYAIVQYTYDALTKENSGYLTIVGLIASLVALALIFPLVAAIDFGQQFSLNAISLSWFHVFFLFCIALFFLVMGALSGFTLKRNIPWYSLPVAIIAIAAVSLLIIRAAIPEVFFGLKAGIIYLIGGSGVMNTVSELEPLFSMGSQFSVLIPWYYFSFAGPIAVLGLAIFLFTMKGKKLNEAEIFLLISTVIMVFLCILQKRFLNIMAVSVSLFAGYALYKTYQLAGLDQYLNPAERKKVSSSRAGSISAALMGVSIVALLLLLPVLLTSISMALSPEPYVLDWNNACAWVADNTPKTSYLYTPDIGTLPEYGIMSWWDYGNYILYRAERPAVANNFQTGIDEASHFFIASNESAADEILNATRSKYIMLDDRMGSPWAGVAYGIFEDMAFLAGDDPMSYHNDNASTITRSMNEKYFDTMYSRLFYWDGCGGNYSGYAVDPLEHYRALYATHGTDPVKVFEYVKGATITGKAEPGSTVEIRLKVSSPYGDRNYTSDALAGPDGRYAFVVPYSTSSSAFVKTDAAYVVTSGKSSASVVVPDSAVENGDTIPVSFF